MRLRRARVEETAALTELAIRSKRTWGYDDAFMHAIMDDMVVRADYLQNDYAIVAEDGNTVVGYSILQVTDGEAYLRDLFIEPQFMNQRVGALLFEDAIAFARAHGAKRLSLTADPNAVGFYERWGLRIVAEEPSTFIPGRKLPIMAIALE